ncbi:NAD(P)/FAD-dependent oxidoreductase [Pseudothermotoga sp.]|nr:FAD-binding oxidoreductase [Pseudothermotoga sp.]MCX7812075.1 FAD-binding oxidoreductase [Pseudothermotoga sp.]MDW8139145.1 FAD-dependent oxidoreductase [Pseudothermotoga sp.]
MHGYDVIVVGAGIIGLSIAYQLVKRKKKVLVLEQGDIASGTSGACDHMILLQSKLPGLPLQMALVSLEMYKAWQEELDENLWFETRGGMILIDKEEHLPLMEEFVERQRAIGLNVSILDKKQIKKKQPFVSDLVIASTFCPDDSQVDPFSVLKALLKAGMNLGLEVRKFSKVIEIKRKSDCWEVRTQDGGEYFSEVLVCAAGVWSREICELIGLSIPIKPKRGQILVTEPTHPIGETDVWDSDYIIAKHVAHLQKDETAKKLGFGFAMSKTHTNNYLIGSTREYVGFDRSTSLEALVVISKRLVELFPVFKNIRIIRSFAGLRPASEDGKYIIGEDPKNPGFFVATGHEGDGIALAPITGMLITQLVCGEETILPIEELSPSRFREVKAEKQSTF